MSVKEEIAPVSASQTAAPPSLLDEIMAQTRVQPKSESYDITRQGVSAFIAAMLQGDSSAEPINILAVDAMIADIDARTSRQMDAIIHAPEFQELESLLRSLKLLVERADTRENIKVHFLNVTQEELLDDFEFAPEITQSAYYKHVYSSGYGQFGGEPVAAVIGNFAFKNTTPDMKLLKYISQVSAMAHSPFLSSVSSEFFGLDSWTELPGIKEPGAIFEGPAYSRWRALRESEDSRYLGLTAPRFLLRHPYSPDENPVKTFRYHEDVSQSHESYLWGNTSFLLAANLAESFAKYRWCPNIIGPSSGGAVKDLPVHLYESMGQMQAKIPTEVLITDRREYELAEEGFITLTMRKGSDNACFFSANSVQKPKTFPKTPEGKAAETNYKLGTQLPYLFVISRLAHYIKVIQREQLGSWKERSDLERELNTWIRQYVADQENPPSYQNPKEALIRSIRRNLRQVLNTRSGSCYGSPELGITDLNDESLASSDFRREIRKSISQCILHYEPRITDVVVTAAAPDEYAPVELCFHIVATVDVSETRGVFEFDILLDNHQRYCVE
ncbi:type VI secretion system contractile sheath large subunit [Escherichia coli]